MRKIGLFLLTLSVPVLLFLSVYQVFRYQNLQDEVAELQEQQIELFEQNKRMIANIAILSSPKRIARLADEILDLRQREPKDGVLRIVFDGEEERPDG